ncbi:DUF6924 domain-containing protein [Catellatospora sichuanensis]|uniref:DUF6924 domain-containing protein n=1 Tax=Catellatospora sichuanensis TaxID=1969805 RepID=UPI003CCC4827
MRQRSGIRRGVSSGTGRGRCRSRRRGQGHLLFLADAVCMTDEEHLLLAVDLFDEPGRSFRLPPRWFPDVSTNLSIANLDFADFADTADEFGTFRGFDGR